MAISKIQSDSITDSAVTSDKISGGAIGVSDLGTQIQGALGTRNLIINGDMNIAQRGTSATGITGAGYHTVDRFHVQINSLGTWTHTQDTDVPTGQGFANSFKLQCTTANASPSSSSVLNPNYRLEGQHLQHLKKGTSDAESVTISFWVKSNKTGTYTLEIYDGDNARQVSKAYTIDTADTWEKKTITFDGDTTGALDNDNNTSLTIAFWIATGSDKTSGTFSNGTWASAVNGNRVSPSQVNLADAVNNYINITGVQLETGDTATPFEHRPYDMELARCQRYYYKTGGSIRYYKNSSNTSAEAYPLGFPVYMRVSPSMSFGTVSTGANTSAYSIAGSSNQSTSVQITANGSAGYARLDAQLIADAEL